MAVVAITKVTLSPLTLTLKDDTAGAITASVSPANATTPIKWTATSSDTKVCTVKVASSTSNKTSITVLPVGAGKTTIYVTAANSATSKGVSAKVEVTILTSSTHETVITYQGEEISVCDELIPVSVIYGNEEIASLGSGDGATLDILGSDAQSKILSSPIIIGSIKILDTDTLGRKWLLRGNIDVVVN